MILLISILILSLVLNAGQSENDHLQHTNSLLDKALRTLTQTESKVGQRVLASSGYGYTAERTLTQTESKIGHRKTSAEVESEVAAMKKKKKKSPGVPKIVAKKKNNGRKKSGSNTEEHVGAYSSDIDGSVCSVYPYRDSNKPEHGYFGYTVDNGCCEYKYTLYDRDMGKVIGCCPCGKRANVWQTECIDDPNNEFISCNEMSECRWWNWTTGWEIGLYQGSMCCPLDAIDDFSGMTSGCNKLPGDAGRFVLASSGYGYTAARSKSLQAVNRALKKALESALN